MHAYINYLPPLPSLPPSLSLSISPLLFRTLSRPIFLLCILYFTYRGCYFTYRGYSRNNVVRRARIQRGINVQQIRLSKMKLMQTLFNSYDIGLYIRIYAMI